METGTDVSFIALTFAVPINVGSFEKALRLAECPATTHVAPPAEELVRPVKPVPLAARDDESPDASFVGSGTKPIVVLSLRPFV
jgi:hypothetical protein